MDPNILMQINEIYCYEVYGDKELADINGWVSQLISEGYDLDDYSDEELYAAYLEDLDEANKSEKFLGLTPKERAEKRNQMANKNTKDRKWVHTSSRDISPKKRRADVEKEYTFNKKSWEKENPGKQFDNINDDDWDDDYGDDREYYKKNPMANVPRVPAPKPGRRKPLGANSIRPVQPFLQFSRAKSKRKQELDTQRQDAQRKEKEEMQKKSDNRWKTMMSIDDLKKRVNAPANKIVPLNREEIECIISYIINEGYADTFNSAELILFNMSEEWIDRILDEVTGGGQVRFRKGLPGDKPKKRGMKETPQEKAAKKLGRLDVDPTADSQRRARLAKVALR